MTPVTDPNVIAQLEGSNAQSSGTPVTDPNILAQLNGSSQQTQNQPSNSGLQNVSDAIQNVTNPIMNTLGQASDTAARGFSNLAFGSEVPAQYAEQGIGAIGQWIQKLGEGVAGGTGYLAQALANKTGAGSQNMAPTDYAAATAGMATSMIPQLLASKYLAGSSTEPDNSLPLKQAQSLEARTGVKAQNFQALYNNPGALFAQGSTEDAGAQLGQAKTDAGINLGVQHNNLDSLTPDNIQMARSPRVIGKDALSSITEDLQAAKELLPNGSDGERIALADIKPDTVNQALQDSNARLTKLIPGTDQYRSEAAIKSNLQNILQNVAPDVKAQNANYAQLKLRDSFLKSDAVNKSGTPSKLALMAQQIPKVGGAAIGGALGGTGGAAVGYEAGKTLAELYHSPYVAGLQTVGKAMANKYIDPALYGVERNASGPAIQAYLANRNKQNGNP